MEGDSCRICRFFAYGECRRFPPQVVRQQDGMIGSDFPMIHPDGWCGEFQKKETPSEA
jgi:hypothetical protein